MGGTQISPSEKAEGCRENNLPETFFIVQEENKECVCRHIQKYTKSVGNSRGGE